MARSTLPTTRATKEKKPRHSAIGAPSQLNQSSRKGKRAWRKNVDIEDVEAGLEEIRQEERVSGKPLQKIANDELFQIDTQGDPKIRHTLPRFSKSQLTSTKILSQRSAVPAVFSRTTTNVKRKLKLSQEEKERLLRIGKKPKKGPFNSILDPSELPAGISVVELSEAVKSSGTYDPWAPTDDVDMEEVKDGLETVQKKKFKPPETKRIRDVIEVPAVAEPHQGASYNPPADAHQELLLEAHRAEERKIREAEKGMEVGKKIREALWDAETEAEGVAPGMKLDEIVDSVEDYDAGGEEILEKKMPERKTKQQRRKAERVLAEKRALAEKAARKRMLATVYDAKILRRKGAQILATREKIHAERRAALEDKLKKQGLAGQRLGRHKVPEGELEVQLGEDLSESLRGLKPEGNLFSDRFKSLQQRALIEPRVPVLPRRRRSRVIEYEKHAWKRFE